MEDISWLGGVAGVLTSSAFIPQAVKTIKDKNTKNISLLSYSMLVLALMSWVLYGIVIKDIPLMVTNFVTLIPAVIVFWIKIKYK